MYSAPTLRLPMRCVTVAAACVMMLCAAARGESLQAALDRAAAHLRAGDAAAARAIYQEQIVDHPQSAELRFGLACADYRAAEAQAAQAKPEAAAAAFDQARAGFNAVMPLARGALRAQAAFNAANCVARKALLVDPARQRAQAIAALREAEAALDAVVREFPDLREAQQNLDHVRYTLKKLLQQPAPEEDQQQQDQQQKQPPPPMVFRLIERADTDLPQARAEVNEQGDTVVLVRPGAPSGGAQP
jgi:hypothetical protein